MNYMSTKISLSYNDFIHVYNECFDEDNVFLDFRPSDQRMGRIAIALDPSSAVVIYSGLRSQISKILDNAKRSDDEIMGKVVSQVDKRIKSKGAFAVLGEIPYGSCEDPREDQIQRGFDYFAKHRDKNRNMVDKALDSLHDEESAKNIWKINEVTQGKIAAEGAIIDVLLMMSRLTDSTDDRKLSEECLHLIFEVANMTKNTEKFGAYEECEKKIEKIKTKLSSRFCENVPNLFESGE